MANSALESGWTTYEVMDKDDRGVHELTPFSASLAVGGYIHARVINQMKTVQTIGWPEAKRRMRATKGMAIAKKDNVIWLLKCSPTCWRLYFYVYEPKKYIIYVHAVCKDGNDEDPQDAIDARSVHDRIGAGGSAITPFDFPPGYGL